MTLNPEALSAAENAYLKSESLTRRGLVADVVEAYLDVAKPPSHLLTLPEGVTFTELPYLPDLSHPSNWLPGDQIRAKRDTIRISSGLIYTIEGVTDDGSVYLEEIDEFYTFPASLFYFVERPEPLPVEAWEVHEEAIAAEGWAEYPAPRFDYGDLVRRVDDGSEFVIDAIEVSSCPKLGAYFYAADIDSCGFEDGLELVVDLPEVEPKFKIGDRVRVIKTDAVRSHLVEGDEFVVVEVSESHFPEHGSWFYDSGEMYVYDFEDVLELVKMPTKELAELRNTAARIANRLYAENSARSHVDRHLGLWAR